MPTLPNVHWAPPCDIHPHSMHTDCHIASAASAALDPPLAYQPTQRYEARQQMLNILTGDVEGVDIELDTSIKAATRDQTGGRDRGPPFHEASGWALAGIQGAQKGVKKDISPTKMRRGRSTHLRGHKKNDNFTKGNHRAQETWGHLPSGRAVASAQCPHAPVTLHYRACGRCRDALPGHYLCFSGEDK